MNSNTSTTAVILVVEDEALLRMNAVDMFEDAGFEVIEASDADEAITILEARSDIRIVFTDIQMPGTIDGIKLAACIRDRWPPIEIIMTSGHIDPKEVELPSRGVYLPKPYSEQELVAVARRMAA